MPSRPSPRRPGSARRLPQEFQKGTEEPRRGLREGTPKWHRVCARVCRFRGGPPGPSLCPLVPLFGSPWVPSGSSLGSLFGALSVRSWSLRALMGDPPSPWSPAEGPCRGPLGPSRAVIDHCPPGRTRNIANGRGRGRADGVVQVLPRRSVRVGPCLRAWHGMPTHAQASPGRCRGMPRHMPRHLLRPATSSYVQLRPRMHASRHA